jgi:hypothetical protein
MGLVIEEKFLNRAVEAYGNEAAAVSEAVVRRNRSCGRRV